MPQSFTRKTQCMTIMRTHNAVSSTVAVIHRVFRFLLLASLLIPAHGSFSQKIEHDRFVQPSSSQSQIVIQETNPDTASFNPSQFRSLPIPVWKPPKDSQVANNILVGYDLRKKTEFVVGPADPDNTPKIRPKDKRESYAPIESQFPPKSSDPLEVQDFGDLVRVSDPTVYPYRANARVFLTFPGTDTVFGASGVLIDPKHVLTAGHVVYSDEYNAWASSIRVVPAYQEYDDYYGPYGNGNAIELYSWTGWTTNQNQGWDIGYMLLDRPVGALTEWLGFRYNDDDNFFKTNTFHNPGYPSQSPYDGQYMYTWSGTFDMAGGLIGGEHLLFVSSVGYRGQSGSGAYTVLNGSRIVYSVLSYVTPSFLPLYTGFARINSEKYTSISSRITANTPAFFDLIPLNVRTSPLSVAAGDQLQSLDYLIHNYSSVTWSGTVTVRIYLSGDNVISTSDRLLETRQYTGTIQPKASTRVVASSSLPIIPQDLAPGTWYVGVILDLQDFNTTNNTVRGWDASGLDVRAQNAPSAPVALAPTNVTSTSFKANWGNVTGAMGYQLDVSDNSTFSSFVSGYRNLDVGNVTSRNVTGLNWGRTYYYRVRAYNSGGPSNNSRIIVVTTKPSAPTAQSPSNESKLSTLRPTLEVGSLRGATEYNFRIFQSGVSIRDVSVASNSWTLDLDLQKGEQYEWDCRARNSAGWGTFFSPRWTFTITVWTEVNSELTRTTIRRFAINLPYLFAATWGGGVFRSTDNGTSWTPVNSGLTNTTVLSLVVNGTNLFAGTDGGGVFLSANNGTTWTAVNSGLPANTQVWSLAGQGTNLFAGTGGEGIFLSSNNGTTWSAVNTGLTDLRVNYLLTSGTDIFAGTAGGARVYLSTNSGTSWTAVGSGLISTVFSLAISGTNLFAATNNDGVFRSTDNGTSWIAVTTGLPPNTGFCCFAVRGQSVFTGGVGVGVFRSTNNGNNWDPVGLSNWSVLTLAYTDSYLFAGTDGGGVYRVPLSDVTSVERVLGNLRTHFTLEQNYPNPFNPATTISFGLPSKSSVSLKVFDALGREVAILLADELSAGTYSRRWSAAGLASGVYFYRLQADSFIETKKLILLK